MSSVRAYYDGAVLVPFGVLDIPKGKVVKLSLVQDEPSETEQRLAAFRQLTDEIRELNKTEPLPVEFDDIMSERVNFTRELDL